MQRVLNRLLLAAFLSASFASSASAHFLFVHLVRGPNPRIELHFAESAWDFSANTAMVDRLVRSRGWIPGGAKLEFEVASYGLVAALPDGVDVASSALTYGVLSRGDTFLLEYHAKGVDGLDHAGASTDLEAEITAERSGNDRLALTVWFRGRPAAGAEISVPVEGLFSDKLTTDADGRVEIDLPATPVYSFRAMVPEKRTGELDGTSYELVKHYTTLTVHDTVRAPAGADSLAWAILTDAVHGCASAAAVDWQASFRASGTAGSATGTIVRGADGVRLAEPTAIDVESTNVQLRLLGWPAAPAAKHSSGVRFPAVREASAGVTVQVPGAGTTYTIRDRHIESVARKSNGGSERLDVTNWKMTHGDLVVPERLAYTAFGADGGIRFVSLLSREYGELDGGYVVERQAATTIHSPAAPMTTTLRISDVVFSSR